MSADLAWFKSSYSGAEGGECLEVALEETGPTVHVRDSKAKSGPTLALSPDAWTTFVNSTTRTAVQ